MATDLSEADLRGEDLSLAHLQGANFATAVRLVNLRGTSLCGADLRGADLGEANLSDANFSHALVDQTLFYNNQGLKGCLRSSKRFTLIPQPLLPREKGS